MFNMVIRQPVHADPAIDAFQSTKGSRHMRKWDRRARQLTNQSTTPTTGADRMQIDEAGAEDTLGHREQLFARLVGRLYHSGSVATRRRLLEELLRPMNTFALIAVANGLFARLKARSAEWQGFQLRDEDITMVDEQDVVALVEHALQGNATEMPTLLLAIGNAAELAQTADARSLHLQLKMAAATAKSAAIGMTR